MDTQNLSAARYSRGAAILHWLIAALIVFNFVSAFVAEDMQAADRMQVMGNHKAVGITILLLTIVRVGWRLTHRPPPPLAGLARWELALSRFVHVALYVLMLGVPLGGWATHSAFSGGAPVSLFGLVDWPGLPFAEDRGLGETFGGMHELFAFAMLGLLVLHIAGALKHRLMDRNADTLKRMSLRR